MIAFPENIGIEAYNAGFRRARGTYILILDDDSFPAAKAIERMVGRFQEDAQLGIVALDVHGYDCMEQDQKKKAEGQHPSTAADLSKTTTYSPPKYLMSFNGAGAGIRRSVMEKVGYYPEEFFLYGNEIDLALRVWDAGYTVRMFPDIIAYHKASLTNRLSWRAPFYYTRNSYWLLWKHYPFLPALMRTFQLMYYSVYFSMEQATWIYLKALFSAWRGLPDALRRRRCVAWRVAAGLRIPWRNHFTFYR